MVLDDCSTDGSGQRIEQTLQSLGDARFRAVLRPANGGQMATMLDGIDATSGPLIAFLDADDLWHPEFLERHVLAHMSSQALAAVSCSNLALIDAQGVQLSGAKPNFINNDPRRKHHELVLTEEVVDGETRVFVKPGIPPGWIWSATSAMMFRRSVVDLLRPARPERIRICADHFLARGSHMLGGTVRIEQSLGCYRLHGSNGFSRNLLLGVYSSFGLPHQDIVTASREETIRSLCDNAERLRVALPRRYLANLLVELAGWEGAQALAARNANAALILSRLSRSRRKKSGSRLDALKRRLKGWFKASSDKPSR